MAVTMAPQKMFHMQEPYLVIVVIMGIFLMEKMLTICRLSACPTGLTRTKFLTWLLVPLQVFFSLQSLQLILEKKCSSYFLGL